MLDPGRYRLRAWIKTRQLTTEKGVGLHIVDPADPVVLNAWTPEVLGDHDWTEVVTDFVVTGKPRLATIQVVRRPSLKFDSAPRGTVWLDDVEIARQP